MASISDPEIIGAIASAAVAVIGAITAFLKRKRIAQYFTDLKRFRLEKKKDMLEAKQAKLAQENYEKFLQLKEVNADHALEALKDTNKTIVEISKTIDRFEGWDGRKPTDDADDDDDDDEEDDPKEK